MALRKAEMEATKVLVLQLLCEFQNYIASFGATVISCITPALGYQIQT